MCVCMAIVLLAADIISCVEFNRDGELLATGDKGGRVVIFQQDPAVSMLCCCYFYHLRQQPSDDELSYSKLEFYSHCHPHEALRH